MKLVSNTGFFLKTLRNDKGLTQEEVADFCEVSAQTINQVEMGEFAYPFDLVLKLSVALGFNVLLEQKEIGNPNRFLLQKSAQGNNYVLTDTENKIVCVFAEKRFNESQNVKLLEDADVSAGKLATTMREISDWLYANHPDII